MKKFGEVFALLGLCIIIISCNQNGKSNNLISTELTSTLQQNTTETVITTDESEITYQIQDTDLKFKVDDQPYTYFKGFEFADGRRIYIVNELSNYFLFAHDSLGNILWEGENPLGGQQVLEVYDDGIELDFMRIDLSGEILWSASLQEEITKTADGGVIFKINKMDRDSFKNRVGLIKIDKDGYMEW